jgi:molybdopterin-guanine dinucleotide biosynthesis adapter protein
MKSPPTVCVVGKKKSGKTTTVVGLVRELVSRGYRVMTAKHGHGFQFDTPGTDSYGHRHAAGSSRVLMAGPEHFAVMGDWPKGGEQELETLVAEHLSDADVVVAEGFKASSVPRIEVFRRSAHEQPHYGSDATKDGLYLAVLTDVRDFDASVPVFDVDDPERFRILADLVERQLIKPSDGKATGRRTSKEEAACS